MLVRATAFAAWPTGTGADRQLLRAALGALARVGVNLLVSAHTDAIARL
jgi:hypothetical protein